MTCIDEAISADLRAQSTKVPYNVYRPYKGPKYASSKISPPLAMSMPTPIWHQLGVPGPATKLQTPNEYQGAMARTSIIGIMRMGVWVGLNAIGSVLGDAGKVDFEPEVLAGL